MLQASNDLWIKLLNLTAMGETMNETQQMKNNAWNKMHGMQCMECNA
jgi:hypothetical protein